VSSTARLEHDWAGRCKESGERPEISPGSDGKESEREQRRLALIPIGSAGAPRPFDFAQRGGANGSGRMRRGKELAMAAGRVLASISRWR
jgi:hypothetical protein